MVEGGFCSLWLLQLRVTMLGEIWYTIDIILWKPRQVLFAQMIAERPKRLSLSAENIKGNKQMGVKETNLGPEPKKVQGREKWC